MITLLLGILIAMVCGAAGFWLRKNTKLTVVEVSAVLALVAGLILPRVFKEGGLFAAICTAVSYAAMSSMERISNYGEMLIVSAICALINYFGQSALVGMGGRLGTSGAISVLVLVLIKTKFNLGGSKDMVKG